MLKLKKIAITGGVSSGKSLVGECFTDLGAYVVDADKIVHQLLTPQSDLGKQVIKLLGESIVVNGEIDRTRIAKKVFLNPKQLRSLEQILHPKVYEKIEREYDLIKDSEKKYSLFVAEVPLLFESKGEHFFDKTVAIVSDPEVSWQRYRKATGHEREDFNRRMARQLSIEEKAKHADYVITNNQTPEELRLQVKNLFNTLQN